MKCNGHRQLLAESVSSRLRPLAAVEERSFSAGTALENQSGRVLSARSGRSSSAPDSGHPGGRICYTPVPGIDQTTHHASCCFTCVVILHFAILRLLNRRLQNMLSGIPMLCGRTVALKQR